MTRLERFDHVMMLMTQAKGLERTADDATELAEKVQAAFYLSLGTLREVLKDAYSSPNFLINLHTFVLEGIPKEFDEERCSALEFLQSAKEVMPDEKVSEYEQWLNTTTVEWPDEWPVQT
jgi:hypothetical protein